MRQRSKGYVDGDLQSAKFPHLEGKESEMKEEKKEDEKDDDEDGPIEFNDFEGEFKNMI